ncbi:hypothetical protein ATANTOWER_029093, partial [Ataeniobius toweri]|nr:hypothetical protein [Ataeniobius toweri]
PTQSQRESSCSQLTPVSMLFTANKHIQQSVPACRTWDKQRLTDGRAEKGEVSVKMTQSKCLKMQKGRRAVPQRGGERDKKRGKAEILLGKGGCSDSSCDVDGLWGTDAAMCTNSYTKPITPKRQRCLLFLSLPAFLTSWCIYSIIN